MHFLESFIYPAFLVCCTILNSDFQFAIASHSNRSAVVQNQPFPSCSSIRPVIRQSLWTCPEGSKLSDKQVCDGYAHCSRTAGDEKNCVRPQIGNTTSGRTVVVDVYVPEFRCSAPVCYQPWSLVNNRVNAHLLCRQLNHATYEKFAPVSNTTAIGLSNNSLQCLGFEANIQQCLVDVSELHLDMCGQLLAVQCKHTCQHELHETNGTLVSPGFPDVSLSMLDCTWTIVAPINSVFVLQFDVVNLQHTTTVDDEHTDCTNSYVEVGLGVDGTSDKKQYEKVRFCGMDDETSNFTSFGNRIYVRYVAGLYFGPVSSLANGFQMHFTTIPKKPSNISSKALESNISDGYAALIGIGTIFTLVFCIGLVVWGLKCRQSKSEIVAVKGGYDMFDDQAMWEAYRKILLRADDELPCSLKCPRCNRTAKSKAQMCEHFKQLNRLLIVEENHRAAKDIVLNRRNTRVSNVTVDLDELLLTRSISVFTAQDPHEPIVQPLPTDQTSETDAKKFLITNIINPIASAAKKLSASSWRTPSPNKASTPNMDVVDEKSTEESDVNLTSKTSGWKLSPTRALRSKLKLSSTTNLRSKPTKKNPKAPKIVIVHSSTRKRPTSPPSLAPQPFRHVDRRRSRSLQLLSVDNLMVPSPIVTSVGRRVLKEPESAPAKLEQYSNFQSLSPFSSFGSSMQSSHTPPPTELSNTCVPKPLDVLVHL